MAKRVFVERKVDSSILGEKLFFPTAKRYASNRFLKYHPEAPGNAIIEKSLDSKVRREALKKAALATKSGGSLAVVQLTHSGRQCYISVNEHPYSASDVQLQGAKMIGVSGFGKPVPLTEEQVKTEVIDKFVYAAKYCYEAGFDGIQLHGAHGYLLAQFMSPTTNKRTDKYGGPVENRARLVLDIYDAI
uniref:NADH:flavin oxidoreductase/NADH oxidase N-terminal domain-containing protein n=1 Tax=Acrobeloides nanus TaxID=290746 RepID=A0A914CGV4_9BILA